MLLPLPHSKLHQRLVAQLFDGFFNLAAPLQALHHLLPRHLLKTRMVVFHDLDNEWMSVPNETIDDAESEWVILDSGSDVSLLPSKYRPDGTSSLAPGALQNCQGGSLQTSGVRKAELVTTTMDGEEILLQHDFIVGNVTSCLVSLGTNCIKVVGQFTKINAAVISA